MGQYHRTFNLTKKQYIYPPKLGDGLKLMEQCGWSPGGTNDALHMHMLLACTSGRGGGDFQSGSELIGSWAGDQIAVIGDYAEKDDLKGFDAKAIYNDESGDYKDITDDLIPILEREYECVYVNSDRIQLSSIEEYHGSNGSGDRNIRIGRASYLSSQVRSALNKYCAQHRLGEKKITVKDLGLKPKPENADVA